MPNFNRGVQHSGTRSQILSSVLIFGSDCPTLKILTTVSNSQALTALDSVQGKSSARHSKLDSVQGVRQPGNHSVRFCPGKFISQALTTSDYVQGVHQPGTHSVRFCPGKFISQALTTSDSVQGVHQPGTQRHSARHSKLDSVQGVQRPGTQSWKH